QIAQIARKRPDMTQMNMRYLLAVLQFVVHGPTDRTIGRSPANNGKIAALLAILHLLFGDIIGDIEDLVAPEVRHLLMIGGIIGDVARSILLLDTADAMFKPRCAGNGPDTG